ncbi:MAG: SRPBCC family protein [Pseudomonadota bacterium]
MKFSAREDINAPIEKVFRTLTEFEVFERAALRRGIDLAREVEGESNGLGRTWRVNFKFRGRNREIGVELQTVAEPQDLVYAISSPNLRGTFEIELVAMSRARTRMRVALDIRPKTLSARLLLQSAKLARNTLNRRYKGRIKRLAQELETRCQG